MADGHLRAEVFTRVVQAVEEDLRLALVGARLVSHLGRPELAALVAPADGEEPHDVRVRSRDLPDVLDHLRVRVVAGVAGRVVGRRARCRGRGRQQRGQQQAPEDRPGLVHGSRCYGLVAAVGARRGAAVRFAASMRRRGRLQYWVSGSTGYLVGCAALW